MVKSMKEKLANLEGQIRIKDEMIAELRGRLQGRVQETNEQKLSRIDRIYKILKDIALEEL